MTTAGDTGGKPSAAVDPPQHGRPAKPLGLGSELERLRADPTLDDSRRELLEALDLRTRRVHQLLGERDQLERQLVRAEKAVQQLSRELGAAKSWLPAAAAARAPLLWHALRERLRAGLGRLRPGPDELRAGPTAASERAPSERSGPLVPLAQAGEQRDMTAVVVCGLAPEEREKVLGAVARQSAAGKIVPLVLTDDDDFAPLRRRSMLFEYLPPAAERERLAPGLEWELYLLRRLALIRRKWRPVRVIAFGRPAADLVRLWSEDPPFEDPALGRLPAAKRAGLEPPLSG